jgi:hypothetical protein
MIHSAMMQPVTTVGINAPSRMILCPGGSESDNVATSTSMDGWPPNRIRQSTKRTHNFADHAAWMVRPLNPPRRRNRETDKTNPRVYGLDRSQRLSTVRDPATIAISSKRTHAVPGTVGFRSYRLGRNGLRSSRDIRNRTRSISRKFRSAHRGGDRRGKSLVGVVSFWQPPDVKIG